jgi:hypothetical protein
VSVGVARVSSVFPAQVQRGWSVAAPQPCEGRGLSKNQSWGSALQLRCPARGVVSQRTNRGALLCNCDVRRSWVRPRLCGLPVAACLWLLRHAFVCIVRWWFATQPGTLRLGRTGLARGAQAGAQAVAVGRGGGRAVVQRKRARGGGHGQRARTRGGGMSTLLPRCMLTYSGVC